MLQFGDFFEALKKSLKLSEAGDFFVDIANGFIAGIAGNPKELVEKSRRQVQKSSSAVGRNQMFCVESFNKGYGRQ